MADSATNLRSLLTHTRDGEWGTAIPDDGLVPVRVIRGTDFEAVRRGDLSTVPTRYVRTEHSARKALRPGDILIETAGGSKGRPTGRTLLIQTRTLESEEIPFTCASFARFIRVDEARIHAPYLYWYLQHLYRIGEMEMHQVQHTGIARFQFTRFAEEIQIPLPRLPEQRAIARILGTLDDKIELNRRMNETLEAMARALFKSWFVDFDPVRAKMVGRNPGLPQQITDLFPDRFVESELGEIPEGWEVSEIGKEVDAVGGGTPSTNEPAYWDDGKHCWVTPKDLSKLSSPALLDTDRKITDAGLMRVSSGLLPIGTVLLSSRAPIGYLAIAEVPTAANQGFIAMVCKKRLPNLYVLFWSTENLDFIKDISGGSTFAEISKKTFRPIPVVVPSEEALTAYEDVVRPLYNRIVANVKVSAPLTQTRDLLLPKLISGQIRFREAERTLEDVE